MTILSSEKKLSKPGKGRQREQQQNDYPENNALARDDGGVGAARVRYARSRHEIELSKRKGEEQKSYPDQCGSIGFQGGEMRNPCAANSKRQQN